MTGGFPPIKYKNDKDANSTNIKLKKERGFSNSNKLNINKLLIENSLSKKKSIIEVNKDPNNDELETVENI
jgi:hypothetical protein